jgi:dihydroxyacetone kinase-like protein
METIPMLATKGRASFLGEKSIGHPDPGATSTLLFFRAMADTVKGQGGAMALMTEGME